MLYIEVNLNENEVCILVAQKRATAQGNIIRGIN